VCSSDLDGFPLSSNPVRTRHSTSEIEIRLQNIEYQLISDKPLGANQMFIRGSVFMPGAGWQRSRRDYIRAASKFDVPTDTGVVFSN
jgi:hypothetical protein